jgi:dihydroflavonol-4-reductase
VSILVTGATGFIGANLVRALLEAGSTVRVLVRPDSNLHNLHGLPVETTYGDLRDLPSLRNALKGCHTLYHVAAHYSLWTPNPKTLYDINVDGTTNILQTALDLELEKVVYTSSVATVGIPADGQPGNETMFLPLSQAIGHYKRSKVLAEQCAIAFCQQGLPLVIVNPSAPVGPWDVKPTPTGKIIVDFLQRKMPAYLDTGLNLVDVRDVAQGHLLAAQRGKIGERYILGCRNMTLRDVLQVLAHVSDLPAPKIRIPYAVALTAGYISEAISRLTLKPPRVPLSGVRMARHPMYFSAHKAIRELGLPQSPIDQAVQRAVQWYRDHDYI